MPTYTKTTEVRGWFRDDEDGTYIDPGRFANGVEIDASLIPGQAHRVKDPNYPAMTAPPRGTFRITVEFTPDE
jgi:hypothetical protein